MFEIESVEARDRYYPMPGEELTRPAGSTNNIQRGGVVGKYGGPEFADFISTDYVVVAAPST